MATQLFTNNYISALVNDIDDTQTTIEVHNGSLLHSPTGGDFELLSLVRGKSNIFEVVKITARSGNVLTVVRGFEGTAQSWYAGQAVSCSITASTLNWIIANAGGGSSSFDVNNILTDGSSVLVNGDGNVLEV